jgi:broad specificity phosphatase PhoE
VNSKSFTPTPSYPEMQRIIFVRHGEAEHNAVALISGYEKAGEILDPLLTSLGERQAKGLMSNPTLAKAWDDSERGPPALVVASPLRRTMATAWLGFGASLPYVLHPDLQETDPVPCDTGSPELGLAWLQKAQVVQGLIDAYSGLPSNWHEKAADCGGRGNVLERWNRFITWVATRPERHIICVAHRNVFLDCLGVEMANCEAVAYDLLEGGQLTKVETPKTTAKRSCSLS